MRWLGVGLAGLVGLILLSLATLYTITEAKLNKIYDVQVEAIPIPSDPAAVERGRHLVTTLGFCTECHGQNYGGQVFDDGWFVGRIGIKNLTSGRGGIGGEFTDTDWVRALRHGVGTNGASLIDMPSNYYYNLSDADLRAVIAYLKSLPPVDNDIPETTLGPLARWYILQEPSLLPAEVIDHTRPHPPVPQPGATVEYGHYLVSFSCVFCHRENLAGEPGQAGGAVPNLTPAGNLAHWTEDEFVHTLRTGVTPEGRKLDPVMMPWNYVGQLTNDELKAIWLYLKSVPAIETEGS
jgi:mono/diheme cytochrome c family protein